MKSRFSTVDIRAAIAEIREELKGLRLQNIYDVDSKTYLLKFNKPDLKLMLLFESGIRIHLTDFDWPKNISPSGFSMKMRKHLRSRRLETIEQVGVDRIVDMTFGSGEASYHIILELYDRGNIVLTDCDYMILNILRPRADNSQDVKFVVREKYPLELAKQPEPLISADRLAAILSAVKPGENLRRTLNPHLPYGPAVLDHCLLEAGFSRSTAIGEGFVWDRDSEKLCQAMAAAEEMLQRSLAISEGYIVQRRDKRPAASDGQPQDDLLLYEEFHPFDLKQFGDKVTKKLTTFNQAVDEFFSHQESQKLDLKVAQTERSAFKKLENVKRDHEARLAALQHEQDKDRVMAELIQMNLPQIDRALMIVRSAIANQIDWDDIHAILREARMQGDHIAKMIKTLKLPTNHMTMLLGDPYSYSDSDEDNSDDDDGGKKASAKSALTLTPLLIDIDLGLSAYANARKYYDRKRTAAHKEQKTVDASEKALKSAEKITHQTLKEAQVIVTINKARRVSWFEKFLWFMTSENYLVIGGRDAQQNEILVKKYFRKGDAYVHADIHGATSIIIKNSSPGSPIPPKTLNEAGAMAVCHSAAWDARVVTSAWWVGHEQVSKTAPSGEYLTTGSFMIRGKKNYLPPTQLAYGYGLLFRLGEDDEESVKRHRGERRVKAFDDDGDVGEEDRLKKKYEYVDKVEDRELGGAVGGVATSTRGGKRGGKGGAAGGAVVKKEGQLPDVGDTVSSGATDSNTDTMDNSHSIGQAAGAVTMIKESHSTSSSAQQDIADDGDRPATDESSEEEFPDTQIKLKIMDDSGFGFKSVAETSRLANSASLSDTKAQPSSTRKQPRKESMSKEKADEEEEAAGLKSQQNPGAGQVYKRRQKSKQKKIREKYKDQDEEEREVIMKLLRSSKVADDGEEDGRKKGKGKLSKKVLRQEQKLAKMHQQGGARSGSRQLSTKGGGGRPNIGAPNLYANILSSQDTEPSTQTQAPTQHGGPLTTHSKLTEADDKPSTDGTHTGEASENAARGELSKEITDGGSGAQSSGTGKGRAALAPEEEADGGPDEDEAEDEEAPQELDILDLFTGKPCSEDVLMYAVPFCAPYSVLQSFKFKVKLTPGNTKRGKAAKMVMHSFSVDKSTTQREKDLIKAFKDLDISRNIPGKVKVASHSLAKGKK